MNDRRIQLLAIDLDGTLLNSRKQITPRTASAIASAREQLGVRVVLASARPPRTVTPFYQRLKLDTPMVNYNGALVYDPPSSRVIMHRPLPVSTAKRIVALARQMYPQVLVSAEIMDRWYTNRFDSAYQTETARLLEPDLIAPIEQWLNQSVTKLLLLGQAAPLAEVERAIHQRLTHQVTTVRTEDDLLQIMHVTVSKAQGLRVVAAELGVMAEHVMAIGDNANDVGMLTWSGTSVAMANAAASAKQAAKFLTDSNDEDGVAAAICRHLFDRQP